MTKRPPRKPVPVFATEREEREFWETHDASPFVDWDRARIAVFPNLKPSTETISLRLPTALKALANKRDVPCPSLLKAFLADRVASEMRRGNVPIDKVVQPSSRRRRKARPRRSSYSARG